MHSYSSPQPHTINRFTSTHQSHSQSISSLSNVPYISNVSDSLDHRFHPFVYAFHYASVGNSFGLLFHHLNLVTVSLVPLALFTLIVLDFVHPSGGLDYVLANYLPFSTLGLLNVAFLLFYSFVCFFMPIAHCYSYVYNEDVSNTINGTTCFESFDAIFSYRWNYIAKRDVEFIQNKIVNKLKNLFGLDQQTYSFKQKHIHQTDLDWFGLIMMSILLTVSMPIFVHLVFVLDFSSSRNSFRYFVVPFLVCMFDIIGKNCLYHISTDLPATERDSFRLWMLLILKLYFFSVPILAFAFGSVCFVTDFALYIFQLFLLTFFCDVIFPFFWYKFRYSRKSFEKPLFDLPLSQAQVFYYHILSFTAQFYVPTFGLVSLPLVYVQQLFHLCSCSFFSLFLWLSSFLVVPFKTKG
ncbi:hypothetical protein GEMRC1_005616 [Eukaryota sp. GEM-RC1]